MCYVYCVVYVHCVSTYLPCVSCNIPSPHTPTPPPASTTFCPSPPKPSKPLKTLKTGLVKGLGQGLVGGLVKPVSGFMEALSNTVEGFDAATDRLMGAGKSDMLLTTRMRLPRAIGGDARLLPWVRGGVKTAARLESLGAALLELTMEEMMISAQVVVGWCICIVWGGSFVCGRVWGGGIVCVCVYELLGMMECDGMGGTCVNVYVPHTPYTYIPPTPPHPLHRHQQAGARLLLLPPPPAVPQSPQWTPPDMKVIAMKNTLWRMRGGYCC